MTEISLNAANLEAELVELSRQINEKRAQLEKEQGIVPEHKEVVREIVGKEVFGESYQPAVQVPAQTQATSQTNNVTPTASYLDRLDQESIDQLNSLIASVPTNGIKKTIAKARTMPPFILDAFHDALVDKLYDELRKSKLVA